MRYSVFKEKKLKQIPDNHGIERRRVLKIGSVLVRRSFKYETKKLGPGNRVCIKRFCVIRDFHIIALMGAKNYPAFVMVKNVSPVDSLVWLFLLALLFAIWVISRKF